MNAKLNIVEMSMKDKWSNWTSKVQLRIKRQHPNWVIDSSHRSAVGKGFTKVTRTSRKNSWFLNHKQLVDVPSLSDQKQIQLLDHTEVKRAQALDKKDGDQGVRRSGHHVSPTDFITLAKLLNLSEPQFNLLQTQKVMKANWQGFAFVSKKHRSWCMLYLKWLYSTYKNKYSTIAYISYILIVV